MYWQVYLHKTTISAEMMLVGVIRRARQLLLRGEEVYATPDLHLFIRQEVRIEAFESDPRYLEAFIQLDDSDIWNAVKMWTRHADRVLSVISRMLLERKLFKILLTSEPPEAAQVREIAAGCARSWALPTKNCRTFSSAAPPATPPTRPATTRSTCSRKKAK
jgi:HD superfamily phosphohydrolase